VLFQKLPEFLFEAPLAMMLLLHSRRGASPIGPGNAKREQRR
jgi:hypothetical protein